MAVGEFEVEVVDIGLDQSSAEELLPGPLAGLDSGDLPTEVVAKLKAAFSALEALDEPADDEDGDVAAELVAEAAQLANKHRLRIAKWTDIVTLPQSRTKCAKWATGKWPWGGRWKVCVGHKVQWRTMECQLFVVAEAPGPHWGRVKGGAQDRRRSGRDRGHLWWGSLRQRGVLGRQGRLHCGAGCRSGPGVGREPRPEMQVVVVGLEPTIVAR